MARVLGWMVAVWAGMGAALLPAQEAKSDGRVMSGFMRGGEAMAEVATDNFSLARGARISPIPPGDPRLDPARPRVLPPALRPRTVNGRRQPMIFLAVSGGGSRAAYYAACVMENLSRIQLPAPGPQASVMDEVRALSSVSGGGLAAGYFVMHHDKRNRTGFYPEMRKTLAVNLQWRTYGGMVLFPPLALQAAGPTVNRTDLLAHRMEKILANEPLTFGDLAVRENNPVDPAPVLLVNGTAYNSGQRFVMTNLPTEFLPSIFPELGRPITNRSVETGFIRKLLEPITPEQLGMDVRSLRVASALSASAAFPMLLAPVRLQIYPDSVPPQFRDRGVPDLLESHYLHIADGGLHDNFGTDTLLSLAKALPPDQPIMFIVIDATLRSETLKLERHKIWWPWTSVLRMYDIGSLRGLGLIGSLFHEVRPRGNHSAVVIKMAAEDPARQSMINRIPTSFAISRANRQFLEVTARANVDKVAVDIQREYARLLAGRPIPPVRRLSPGAAQPFAPSSGNSVRRP